MAASLSTCHPSTRDTVCNPPSHWSISSAVRASRPMRGLVSFCLWGQKFSQYCGCIQCRLGRGMEGMCVGGEPSSPAAWYSILASHLSVNTPDIRQQIRNNQHRNYCNCFNPRAHRAVTTNQCWGLTGWLTVTSKGLYFLFLFPALLIFNFVSAVPD